jgi:hypothetical protein
MFPRLAADKQQFARFAASTVGGLQCAAPGIFSKKLLRGRKLLLTASSTSR